MSRKKMEELVLEVPWGKLAMATWGDSAKPPVLLVHGYVDSAATFVPLVNLLPDDYYYVALDLPGHGRSDPMPGPTISQLHLVESINQIVEQLRRADPRLYSYEEAVSLVVRARDVTEEQSELILSRSLVKEEDEKYSLTWGHKVKKISTVPILFDMFYATLSTKAPTLSVVASETPNAGPTADYAAKMFKKLQSEMKDFLILNVEVISWGNPDGPPALLVHGRQDSAATFAPLLELLPETYHYVGFDIPGNGLSDPLPHGVMLCRIHFIGALELVVRLFYNAVYPNRISKLVLLDPGPSWQRLQVHDPVEYFNKQKALESVSKARGFTPAQAELVLLSWDKRLKYPAPQNYPTDFYYRVWSKNIPPTLMIAAKSSQGYSKGKAETVKLIADLEKNVENFLVLNVEGGHDVHFTNPERFVKEFDI
ncbi:hypothetical protein MSG28_014626 [Choristoneura fumiferana]|uniref:Uncharacterized protein n=2 Tax=Choristoneura fumiferana TaxID=7141 RepID=A0ACC0JS54_CHOFU|nr:hypothetical protein MSG28_014626 [Choristoneura fumiferana]KAI8426967.1 hypothetical protein MSG28_014626 [Choristoneura fumiferana]